MIADSASGAVRIGEFDSQHVWTVVDADAVGGPVQPTGLAWFDGDLLVCDALGDRHRVVEIERVLYEHPAVYQAAVVPVPHERWGEVGKAVLVLKEGAAVSAEAILAHCGAHLARYKIPKHVEFRESMPLSPAGKILKRELR